MRTLRREPCLRTFPAIGAARSASRRRAGFSRLSLLSPGSASDRYPATRLSPAGPACRLSTRTTKAAGQRLRVPGPRCRAEDGGRGRAEAVRRRGGSACGLLQNLSWGICSDPKPFRAKIISPERLTGMQRIDHVSERHPYRRVQTGFLRNKNRKRDCGGSGG